MKTLGIELPVNDTEQAKQLLEICTQALVDHGYNPYHILGYLPEDNLGVVRWSVDDIRGAVPDLTDEQLEAAAEHIDRRLPDILCEYGNEAISEIARFLR